MCLRFFRKGKSAFWKLALKKHEFLQLFGKLGLEFRVNQQLFDGLEVCVFPLRFSKEIDSQ